MNAFLIVCPHCQAKYQVASADAHGKTVACKKCSQKFAAKVMQARPKAAPAAVQPASSPVADDDPFGDLISSAASSTPQGNSSFGPSPLSAKPRKKGTSKEIPWGIIGIGGGAVAMLVVLVIVGVSFLSSVGASGSSSVAAVDVAADKAAADKVAADKAAADKVAADKVAAENNAARMAEEDFAAHSKIADAQVEIMTEFVDSIDAVQQETDVPVLLEKIETLTTRVRGLTDQVRGLPKLSEKQNEELLVSVKTRLKPLEGRAAEAGLKLISYQSAELMEAVLGFQTAAVEMSEVITSAQPRTGL